MTVIGVLTKANVGDNEEIGIGRFYLSYGLLHNAIGCEVLLSYRVLVGRNAEENDAGNARTGDFARLIGYLVNRHAKLPRHGRDFLANIAAVLHKEWIEEVGRRQSGLVYQPTKGRRAPQSSRPGGGERCELKHSIVLWPG